MKSFLCCFALALVLSIVGLSQIASAGVGNGYLYYIVFSDVQTRKFDYHFHYNDTINQTEINTVYMAQNEREGFQIYFRSAKGNHNIKVEVSAFKHKTGATLKSLLYKEHFFNVSDMGYTDEYLSDPLIPYDGKDINVKEGSNMAFYIDLRSTAIQIPGDYKGTVKLYVDGKLKETNTVTAVVWNFCLPRNHLADAVMGMYNSASGYRGTSFFLKLNGVNLSSNGEVVESDKDRALEIVSSYQDYLLDHGVTTYEIPRFLIDKDPYKAAMAMADVRRKMFMIPSITLYEYDPAKKNMSSGAIRIINKHLAAMNGSKILKDKAFFYLVDEPAWTDDRKAAYLGSVEVLNKIWPGFHSVVPFYADVANTTNILKGRTDIYCPAQGTFVGKYKNGTEYIKIGQTGPWHKVWFYPGDNQCGSLYVWIHKSLTNGINRRILLWQQYMLGFNGILFWNLCFFKADPFLSDKLPPKTPPANVNGDGYLIYPGGSIGQDPKTPIPSLRLKQFSNGMDDYDYLRLYEEVVGKEKTRELVMSKVMVRAKNNPNELWQKGSAYSETNPRAMEEVRKVIGEYLSKHHVHHKYGKWEMVVPRLDDDHPGMDIRTCSVCGAQEYMDHFDDLTTFVVMMDELDESDLNITDMVLVISNLTGIDPEKVRYDIDINDNEEVRRILFYAPNNKIAEDTVESINYCASSRRKSGICSHEFFKHVDAADVAGASSTNVFLSLVVAIVVLVVTVTYY